MAKQDRSDLFVRLVVGVAAGASAALGLVVLVGWYTQTASLIQVRPAFVPMQYNTALGFLVSGTGLLVLLTGRSRLGAACGGIVAAVGLWTLAEYGAGLNLGIDQLLMEPYITVHTSDPGRMAPTTALSFVFTGGALVLNGLAVSRRRPWMAGLLAALVLALGLGTFLGYLQGAETPYGWRHTTYMAVHTAAGFAVLGTGVLAQTWREDAAKEAGLPWWLPIPVGVAVAIVAVLLWQGLVAQEHRQLRQAVDAEADKLKREVQELLHLRILALERMARRWETRPQTSKVEWEADAALYVAHQPDYQAIEWVDETYHVRWVVPVEGNEAALNLNLASEEQWRKALTAARGQRAVTVTQARALEQGGTGFLASVPLFIGEDFDGFMVGVFRVHTLLDPILSASAARGYAMAIFDGEQEIIGRYGAEQRQEAVWEQETALAFYNGAWRMRVWLSPDMAARQQSALPETVLTLGLLTAFLLAFTVRFAQTARLRAQRLAEAGRDLEAEIAERKQTQEALAAREKLYRTLTETIPHVIWLGESDGEVTYQNKAYEELTGRPLEETLGFGWADDLHPDDAEALLKKYEEAYTQGKDYRGECRFRAKDGSYKTVAYIGMPVKDEAGKIVQWVGINTDITERKQAEEALMALNETLEQRIAERTKELAASQAAALRTMEDAEAARRRAEEANEALTQEIAERGRIEAALRESEARFRLVVEAAPNALIMIDQAGTIVLVNSQAEQWFGYARDELIGQPIEVLVPERFHTRHMAYRSDYFNALQARPMGVGRDLYGRRKDGSEFPIEIGLNPIPTGAGVLVLSSVVDITKRKRAALSLKRYAAELKRSNQELEQFASVASHDLQEPLRKVINYTELLARRYEGQLDEKADKFIDYVVDGARRMQGLINDLLAFSRVGTHGKTFAPTDLDTVLDDALSNLDMALVEGGVEVTRDPLPTVQADGIQLTQLFQNLIGNALKFRGAAPPTIHVGAERRDGAWRLSVADNGIGIDPAYADRIFIIFQRLHGRDAYPGTGIGLAICKKVVERHGGRIWVESQPGEGATFYFTLPTDGGHQP